MSKEKEQHEVVTQISPNRLLQRDGSITDLEGKPVPDATEESVAKEEAERQAQAAQAAQAAPHAVIVQPSAGPNFVPNESAGKGKGGSGKEK